ncbi:MAG: hypothetical protein R2692_03875 [Microbacterium sp.]
MHLAFALYDGVVSPSRSCSASQPRSSGARSRPPSVMRLVPMQLQGRIKPVNMVGVFGGLVIGQTSAASSRRRSLPRRFGGFAWWSLVTLVIVWRSPLIAAAKPVLDTADDPDPSLGDHEPA